LRLRHKTLHPEPQALLSALALERLTAGILLPLVGVLAKWAIIGRSVWGERVLLENLLVRIHLVIEMIFVDQPCAMGV